MNDVMLFIINGNSYTGEKVSYLAFDSSTFAKNSNSLVKTSIKLKKNLDSKYDIYNRFKNIHDSIITYKYPREND